MSRGLVRSVGSRATSPPGRARRYDRSDIERLKARHDARAGHGAVAGAALRWGEPVLDSAITAIDDDGPRYRGHLATHLAESGARFESVAELLWEGTMKASTKAWRAHGAGVPSRLRAVLPDGAAPLSVLSLVVPVLAARDPGRFAAPIDAELARARSLLVRMTASLSLAHDPKRAARALECESIARAIAYVLGARNKRDAELAIDQALILCADHELNASTFAARVTASTGADVYACVTSALATLSGPLHGGTCDRVESMVGEALRVPHQRVSSIIHQRARRGEAMPGFGHQLYPVRDPRAQVLLDVAHAIAPKNPGVRAIFGVIRAMRDAGREPPTLDIGLVAVSHALSLPSGSALALFAIGRTAGWIAHALEQRASGFLLRPRARYVGPQPA